MPNFGAINSTTDTPLGWGYPFEARLTLETGVPFSTTAQTAKTDLYLTKNEGDQIAVFDAGGNVEIITLGADASISLASLGRSQAYTNDPAAGSNITLNMANTDGFLVGRKVKVSSSAGSEEARITTVTANTSIVVNALTLNHTTTNPLVITMLPYDVFVYNNAGAPALELLAWTDVTTRATAITTQGGVKVKTGDITRRLAGTILMTLTIGECEMSATHMGVSNLYNQMLFEMFTCPGYSNGASTTSYTTTSTTFVEANSGIGSRLNFILCDPQALTARLKFTASSTSQPYGAIGFDTVTDPTIFAVGGAGGAFVPMFETSNKEGVPLAAGGHYAAMLMANVSAGTLTAIADLGTRAGATADPKLSWIACSLMM